MKKTQVLGLLLILAVLVLPTDPITDLLITIPLISLIGFEMYLKLAVALVGLILLADKKVI